MKHTSFVTAFCLGAALCATAPFVAYGAGLTSETTDLPIGAGNTQFINIGTNGMIGFGLPIGTTGLLDPNGTYTQKAYINSINGNASFTGFVGDSTFTNAVGLSNTTTFQTNAVAFASPAVTFGGITGTNSTVTFEGTLNSVNFNGKYPQNSTGVFNTNLFAPSGQVQFGRTLVGGVAGGDFPGGFVNIQPPGFTAPGQTAITFGHGATPGQAAIYSDGTAFFGDNNIMLGTFGMTIGALATLADSSQVYPIVMYNDGSASFAKNSIVLGANGNISTGGTVSVGTPALPKNIYVSGNVDIGPQEATPATVSAANQLGAWIYTCMRAGGGTLAIDSNGNMLCGHAAVPAPGPTTTPVDHNGHGPSTTSAGAGENASSAAGGACSASGNGSL